MCTENYIKSKTPITDLSNYCLSKNANIPTQTYSTTTPTDPIVLTSTLPKLVLPNITLPTISSNKQQYTSSTSAPPAPFSSSSYYYDINKPTKLDLLIQTATMNQSQAESFKPNNNDFSCLINTSSGPSSTTSSLNNDSSTSSTSSVDGSSSPSNINVSNSISIQSTEPTVENSSNFYVYSPENTKKRKMILNSSLSMEKSNSLSDIIKKPPIITSDNKKSTLKKQKNSNDSSSITTTDAIKVASPSLTSKRQRSGPSCDCCRSRKIKCDSEITILSTVSNLNASTATTQESLIKESQIAHCSFLFKDDSNYQYFQINSNSASPQPSSPPSSASVSFSANKLNSFKFLKFKSCSACKLKSLNCCFSKGFTRNDIIKFNKSEKLHSDSSQNRNEPSVTRTLLKNELALDSNTNTSSIKPTTESLKNSNYLSVINLSSQSPYILPPTSSLLPSSMGHLEQQEQPKDIDPTSSSNSNNTSKNSKKTSCKSCRFKKIKCIKIEASTSSATGNGDDSLGNTAVCLNCSKKNLNCIYN